MTKYSGSFGTGDVEQGVTSREIKRFGIADLEEQKAKADEEMA